MTQKKIISPMPWGNGAFISHRLLEANIQGYKVLPYNPYMALFPFLLKFFPKSTTSFDLIHTTPDHAVFFQRSKIPTVITFHNYVIDQWMMTYSSFFQKIHYLTDLRLFTRLAVNSADCITTVSRFVADLIRKDLDVKGSVHVIYNGVDEEKFVPNTKKYKNGKQINVFFSGNLTMRKGVQWIPEIAKKLSHGINIHYTSGLRTARRVLESDRLIPLGKVPYHKMPETYHNMDILLMPTVREGFGLSVVEAMSCGLPVVASDCSAIPELIDHEKGGFLCPIGDVDAFSEKINFLAESPNKRKEMGEYNRQKVEKMFTLNRMANEYGMLFERILDKQHS